MVQVEGFSPENKVEEAVLSLIFFLETDLVLTRELLKSQSLSELDVNINGNKILIQARKIISIERNSFEVEYRNTRKILC